MFTYLNRRDLFKTYQYAVCQGKAKANRLSNAKKERKKCCLCFLSSHVFMFTKKKAKVPKKSSKGPLCSETREAYYLEYYLVSGLLGSSFLCWWQTQWNKSFSKVSSWWFEDKKLQWWKCCPLVDERSKALIILDCM